MHVLRANGYDMAYAEHGAGTPLLLIHGSLLDQRWWAPQMGPLGRRHRVVAPSLRHYWPARWDGAGDDFTVDRHVEDVVAFIAALGAGPVALVGHSRGGHVAFRVAQHHPRLVRALVLAEPSGRLDGDLLPGGEAAAELARRAGEIAAATALGAERVRRGDVEGAPAPFVDAVNGPGAWEAMAADLKAMHRDNAVTLLGQVGERRAPFSRADLGALRAPTLLVGGGASLPPFPQILDALERGIAGAARATIPGAGHLTSREEPEAFNGAVLGFLAERG